MAPQIYTYRSQLRPVPQLGRIDHMVLEEIEREPNGEWRVFRTTSPLAPEWLAHMDVALTAVQASPIGPLACKSIG